MPDVYQLPLSTLEDTRVHRVGRPVGTVDQLPRHHRAVRDSLGRFEPTSRDMAIVEALYRYRALTSEQVLKLFFTDQSQCRLRLKLLFHHGYVFRREQLQYPSEPRKPFIYFPDAEGIRRLAEMYGVTPEELDWTRKDRYIKQLKLDHLLLRNSFRTLITLGASKEGFPLVEWRDERTLERTHKKDTFVLTRRDGHHIQGKLIPDDFFRLQVRNGVLPRFVEIDCSTETVEASNEDVSSWSNKVDRYSAYYYQGFYERRYSTKSMGVLTIIKGVEPEKRLENLKRATEKRGGRDEFWFTTFERLSKPGTNVFHSPVWNRAQHTERFSMVQT